MDITLNQYPKCKKCGGEFVPLYVRTRGKNRDGLLEEDESESLLWKCGGCGEKIE